MVSGLGSRVEASGLYRTLWVKASPEAEGGGGACVGKWYVLRVVHIIRIFRWSQICSQNVMISFLESIESNDSPFFVPDAGYLYLPLFFSSLN